MNLKKSVSLLLCTIGLCIAFLSVLGASSTLIVQGEARISMAGLTPEEADDKALSRAKLNALENAFGSEVRGVDTVYQEVTTHSVTARSLKYVTALSLGEIQEYKVLERHYEQQKRADADIPLQIYYLRLEARVSRLKDAPDPYFKVRCSLNRTYFSPGDEIEITVESTKNCYVTVLSISPAMGKACLVFPNIHEPDGTLKSGEVRTLPSKGLKEIGITYRAGLPEGKTVSSELVEVIAALGHPIEMILFSEKDRKGLNASIPLEKLEEQLVNLPRKEWSLCNIGYTIESDKKEVKK